MSNADDLVKRLRELMAKATPGKWHVGPTQCDDEGFPEIPIHAAIDGLDPNAITPAVVLLQFPTAAGREMQAANADLVATLINSAPEMLDALTASTAKVSALQDRVKELEADAAAKQAKIDQLMLEYCPKDMTPEQIEEWGKNQQVSSAQENTND